MTGWLVAAAKGFGAERADGWRLSCNPRDTRSDWASATGHPVGDVEEGWRFMGKLGGDASCLIDYA